MNEREERGRFLVGLAGEITNNVKRGLQSVGKSFTNHIAASLTVISAQGVSHVVGLFDREPTKSWDLIKPIEKYVLLPGEDDNQSKRLVFQTSRNAVRDYLERYMIEYPENSWEQLKSELNVRFAEVNDHHHAFTMLHKARQFKYESVHACTERLYTLANDAFTKVDKGAVESQLGRFSLMVYSMTFYI